VRWFVISTLRRVPEMSTQIYQQMYMLADPVLDRPYRGKLREPFDVNRELSRGEAVSDRPIRVGWAEGGATPGDIIWTTSGCPLIVHERVLELFRRLQFTGWGFYPVQVSTKTGEQLHGYHGLTITGRCGPVDLARSEVVLRQLPGGTAAWLPHFLGHYFPPESWDESDLFMESPDSMRKRTCRRFVTQRVRDAILGAKITNVALTRLTEVCVIASTYTVGSKHLLPLDYGNRVEVAYKAAGVPRPPSR
jgi:hypothetical protein